MRYTFAKIFCLSFMISISLSSIALAQQNELIYKQITTKDGLQDDITISIVQDDKGFMWFGTRSGLVRYDGTNMKTYSSDPDFPDGLNGNNINSLNIDKSGVLWIGTINGLCRYDVKLDRPVNIPIRIDNQIISPDINYINSSDDGLIWIGTIAHGLIMYDPLNSRFIQYLPIPGEPNSILNKRISAIAFARDNKVWIGTGKGLNSFDRKSNTFTAYKHEKGNPNTISEDRITSLALGEDEELWIGTLSAGLNRMNLVNGEIKRYKHEANNDNSLSDNYISIILYDNKNIWFGSGRGSEALNKLNPNTGIVTRLNFGENSLISGSVNAIFKDRAGIIWVAQGLSGINYFDPSWKNYDHILIDNDNKEDLTNRVYGINSISDTQLWASTFGGLILFDLKKGIVKKVTEKNKTWLLNNNSIEINDVLWIPSRNYGVIRYNLTSSNISYIMNDEQNNKGLSSNYVNIILKDSQGIIWAGSRDGGLDRIDPKTLNIKRYNHIPNNPESIPDNHIYALLEENEYQLWVGSNGGLALFDKRTETFKNYPYDPDNNSSVSSNQISYILKSKDGTLWVSTYGGGLNRFDSEKEEFKRYTSQKNNIPDNTVYSTLEDESGNIWVSTAAGVARFSPAKETYDYIIDKPDFYKATKFPNGKLGFSGPHGILVFDPKNINFNANSPTVSLTKFLINVENYTDEIADSLRYTIDNRKEIELDYFQNDISLEFMAAHYSDSKKNKLAVFLDGYDREWRLLDTERRINYTNLDPGEYIMNAKAASAYGVWTKNPYSFIITIEPPLWRTWWAYIFYLFFALGFFYSVRKFELKRRTEKENKRLLELENKRKSEELEEAKQLQLSMLPKVLPKLPNLDVAVYMQTATEVGGDYYDFVVSEDGTLNVGIGDGTGHGMQAGTLVTLIKGLFTSEVSSKKIQRFFNDSNRTIKEINLGRLMMAFSLLKIKGNQLQFSSAGMPPMYIYRNELKIVKEIDMQGMPLGALRNFEYKLYDTVLKSGDCVLLMSDGYPELSNSNNEQLGYERVKAQFAEIAEKHPDEIIQYFKNSGSEWVNDKDPDDDVTFVVFKVK